MNCAISIENLSLKVGSRELLRQASLSVPRGEVVLLVGLSGSGKSVTLKLLLGLIDRHTVPFQIDGKVQLFGEDNPGAARRHGGIVFQDYGLLDEWSTRENLEFGLDHRRERLPAGEGSQVVDGLLGELHLDGSLKPSVLSGGMKQRCAIARTLAHNPDIIFYDEPTSGLDPAMSKQVAQLIRQTNDEHRKTSFVVTHDLGALADMADRIILLDPQELCFREIAKADVHATMASLADAKKPEEHEGPQPRRRCSPVDFFTATGRALEAAAQAVSALIPRWPRFRWGLRYLLYYLRLSTFGSALGYVALCGFILGLIVTWFTFSFLPFKAYTEPLLIDNVIGAIGFSLYRIMVPGMVAMLVAARSGAAIAADMGNRVYTRQTDAMRSLGIQPHRYLLSNIVWAHLLGMPVLIVVNFLMARLASLLVFAAIKTEYSTWFWTSEFPRFLSSDGTFYLGSLWLLGKSLLSAFGVATIATFLGLRPKDSGRAVAASVTAAIIWSTLFVLLVQTVFALLEFDPIT